jgi:hypothetical protein
MEGRHGFHAVKVRFWPLLERALVLYTAVYSIIVPVASIEDQDDFCLEPDPTC